MSVPSYSVTILAILVDETGNLVLAADGMELKTDEVLHIQLWSQCDKIMSIPRFGDQSLAWGYTGRGEGDELAPWFEGQVFDSWNDLKGKLAQKVGEINATLLDCNNPHLGPIMADPLSSVSVVVAGFVGGVMDAFAMDPLGGIYTPAGKATFVGMSAEDKATPEWRRLVSDGGLETRESFVSLLVRLINENPWLRFPLNVWIMTTERLELVAQISGP